MMKEGYLYYISMVPCYVSCGTTAALVYGTIHPGTNHTVRYHPWEDTTGDGGVWLLVQARGAKRCWDRM